MRFANFMLNLTIPANRHAQEIYEVLNFLIKHPNTARFYNIYLFPTSNKTDMISRCTFEIRDSKTLSKLTCVIFCSVFRHHGLRGHHPYDIFDNLSGYITLASRFLMWHRQDFNRPRIGLYQ